MNRLVVKFLSVCFLFFIITISAFSTVLAEGNIYIKDYKENINLYKNDTYTFVLKADNAVGKVHVYSEKDNVSYLDSDYIWINMNEFAITVTAKQQGNSIVHIQADDCATYDEELLEFDYTFNVKVVEKNNESNQTESSIITSDSNDKIEIENKVKEYNIKNEVNDIDTLTKEEEKIYEDTVITEKIESDFSLLGINKKIKICIAVITICILLISVLLIIKSKKRRRKI